MKVDWERFCCFSTWKLFSKIQSFFFEIFPPAQNVQTPSSFTFYAFFMRAKLPKISRFKQKLELSFPSKKVPHCFEFPFGLETFRVFLCSSFFEWRLEWEKAVIILCAVRRVCCEVSGTFFRKPPPAIRSSQIINKKKQKNNDDVYNAMLFSLD